MYYTCKKCGTIFTASKSGKTPCPKCKSKNIKQYQEGDRNKYIKPESKSTFTAHKPKSKFGDKNLMDIQKDA